MQSVNCIKKIKIKIKMEVKKCDLAINKYQIEKFKLNIKLKKEVDYYIN